MARRKKASRRRSPRAVSLLNVAESYAYANIMTQGIMGTSPMGFVTGEGDAGMVTSRPLSIYDAPLTTYSNPDGAVSLSDIISQPEGSFAAMQAGFKANYQTMAVNSILTGITFRVGKRLLRRPISNVNRNVFKPLGAGFKL